MEDYAILQYSLLLASYLCVQDETSHMHQEPWLYGLNADIILSDAVRLENEALLIAGLAPSPNLVSVEGLVTLSCATTDALPAKGKQRWCLSFRIVLGLLDGILC